MFFWSVRSETFYGPFGSGGNRVSVEACFPLDRSFAMISRMKSSDSGAASPLFGSVELSFGFPIVSFGCRPAAKPRA